VAIGTISDYIWRMDERDVLSRLEHCGGIAFESDE
jgi:hypothetical protein